MHIVVMIYLKNIQYDITKYLKVETLKIKI